MLSGMSGSIGNRRSVANDKNAQPADAAVAARPGYGLSGRKAEECRTNGCQDRYPLPGYIGIFWKDDFGPLRCCVVDAEFDYRTHTHDAAWHACIVYDASAVEFIGQLLCCLRVSLPEQVRKVQQAFVFGAGNGDRRQTPDFYFAIHWILMPTAIRGRRGPRRSKKGNCVALAGRCNRPAIAPRPRRDATRPRG